MSRSPLRSTKFGWFRIATLMIAAGFGLIAHTASAQPMSEEEVDQLLAKMDADIKEADELLAQARAETMTPNQAIAEARAEFWRTFPDKPGFADAQKEFEHQMLVKDIMLFTVAVREGETTSFRSKLQTATITGGGKLDGGVRPAAYAEFWDFVNALRWQAGAKKQGDLGILLLDPRVLTKAFDFNKGRYFAYVNARRWAELYAGGVDLSRIISPKTYALWLCQRSNDADKYDLSFPRPDPHEAALKTYRLLVRAYGEKQVLDAASRVLKLPKDRDGDLQTRVKVNVVSYQIVDEVFPQKVFIGYLVDGDARAFAMGLCIGSTTGNWAETLNYGLQKYDELSKKYGKAKVLATATQIRNTPMSPGGSITIGKLHGTMRDVFIDLMNGVDANAPEKNYPHFDAATVTDEKLRSLNSNFPVVMRGTVERVEVYTNIFKISSWILHFRGVKDDLVVGEIDPRNSFAPIYGEHGEKLVGKSMEMIACPDWGMREYGKKQQYSWRFVPNGPGNLREVGADQNADRAATTMPSSTALPATPPIRDEQVKEAAKKPEVSATVTKPPVTVARNVPLIPPQPKLQKSVPPSSPSSPVAAKQPDQALFSSLPPDAKMSSSVARTIPEYDYVYLSAETSGRKLSETSTSLSTRAVAAVQDGSLKPTGPTIYTFRGASADPDKSFQIKVGWPVSHGARPPSGFEIETVPAHRVATLTVTGKLDDIGPGYARLYQDITRNKLTPGDVTRNVIKTWAGPASDQNVIELRWEVSGESP